MKTHNTISFLFALTLTVQGYGKLMAQTWEVYDKDYKLLRKIENGNLNYLGNSLRINNKENDISLLSQDYETFVTVEDTEVRQFLEPWVIIAKGEKLGALHEYGDMVFQPEYDHIESYFNLLLGKKGSMYEVYDRGTKQTKTFGPYQHARLARNGQLIAQTPQGMFLPFSPEPNRIFEELEDVSTDVILAKEPTGYGLINRDGEYILEPIIDTLEYLGDNHFFAHDGNQYMLIKAQTNNADIKYTSYHRITRENGILLEYIHGRLRRIMRNDGILLDIVGMTEVIPVPSGHYNVHFRDQKIGLLSPKGKWEVQPSSGISQLFPGNLGLFGALINGKFGFVDSSGRQVINAQFDDIRAFSEGLAPVKVGNLWGYVNLNGDMVIAPQFDRAGEFFRGMAVTTKYGEGSNLINKEGQFILEESYDRISLTDDNYYLTEKSGRFGLVNPLGQTVAPALFEEIRRQEFNRIVVRRDGRYGIMREDGNLSLPIYFTNILFDETNNKILARHNDPVTEPIPEDSRKRSSRRTK